MADAKKKTSSAKTRKSTKATSKKTKASKDSKAKKQSVSAAAAEKNSKKSQKSSKSQSLAFRLKTKKTKKKKQLKPQELLRRMLIVSLVVNLILGVLVLKSVSNPTSYTDATAGYTISLPPGWTRIDTDSGAIKLEYGKSAKILGYGQRAIAAGFYDQDESEQERIIDGVVDQINAGSNQFLIADVGLLVAEYQAVKEKDPETNEYAIRVNFTGTNAEGKEVEGMQYILITKSGGIYNVVGMAEKSEWPKVKPVVESVIQSFKGS